MTILTKLDIPYETYRLWPLGHFLEKNEEMLKKAGCNEIQLVVSNEYISGRYDVPLALGLSTPVEILKGASIELYLKDTVVVDIYKTLALWKKTFAGPTFKEEKSYSFSLDQRLCQLCHKEYLEGDILLSTSKCEHIFHKSCLKEWEKKGKTSRELTTASVCQIPLAFLCPLCKTLTSIA